MKRLLLLLGVIGVITKTVFAQTVMQRSIEPGADGIFHLKELQVILTSENDTIWVLTALPDMLRPEEYAGAEIDTDDKIIMVNGQRMKTIKKFEEMYNTSAIGKEIKLGLRKNKEFAMVSFAKLDPADMPAHAQVMIRTGDEDDEAPLVGMTTRNLPEGSRPWIGTGLVLKRENGQVKVVDKIYSGDGDLQQIETGAILKQMNDLEVQDIDQLLFTYEDLEVGADVKLLLTQNGKPLTVSFKKAELEATIETQPN